MKLFLDSDTKPWVPPWQQVHLTIISLWKHEFNLAALLFSYLFKKNYHSLIEMESIHCSA